MAKRRIFQVIQINNETGEEETIGGEFTEEEHQVLVDFMDYAEALSTAPFLRSDNQGSAKMGQDGTGPLKFEITLPDWYEVMVFIHLLRPLILENERTNFNAVGGLLGKYLKDSWTIRQLLRGQRDMFSGRRDQRIIQFRSNDTLLNSEPVLQAYLNGFEYHRDKDKQVFVQGLHQMLPLDFSKVIFVGMLLDKASAIFSLADLVAVTVGKQKEIGFRFYVPDKNKGLKVP